MSENGNMPAYPYIFNGHVEGLTKREVMAAMAMQGMLTTGTADGSDFVDPNYVRAIGSNMGMDNGYIVAKYAVHYADALLAELERTKKP